MNTDVYVSITPMAEPAVGCTAELERLGDEIVDECGLNIHARTSMPGWLGERLDVGWAIDVLHPLAAP